MYHCKMHPCHSGSNMFMISKKPQTWYIRVDQDTGGQFEAPAKVIMSISNPFDGAGIYV